MDQLQSIVNEEKFHTFKWYCAGDPLILGVIESVENNALSKTEEILKIKQDKNIWITIQKEKVKNPGVVNG